MAVVGSREWRMWRTDVKSSSLSQLSTDKRSPNAQDSFVTFRVFDRTYMAVKNGHRGPILSCFGRGKEPLAPNTTTGPDCIDCLRADKV